MLRPVCIKLASRAIHRGRSHAAVSHRVLPLISFSGREQVGQGCAIQGRTLASSSSSPTSGPPIQKSVDKSQEAIDKAEQLHKELNEMIKAQKDRQREEAQRPFGSGLVQFFKASKPEMFNIFFAFVCGECSALIVFQSAPRERERERMMSTPIDSFLYPHLWLTCHLSPFTYIQYFSHTKSTRCVPVSRNY